MKAVYVGGTCEFCEYIYENYDSCFRDESCLVKGRVYTIIDRFFVNEGTVQGYGVRVAEYTLPPGWGHCSCGFREIDGDDAEWRGMLKKDKSKTKELETV